MNKNYPFALCVITILIGPLLWIIFEIMMSDEKAASMFMTLPAFIVVGLIMSSPVLVLCFLVFTILNKYNASYWSIKITLITISIIGIVMTFKLLGGLPYFTLTISYSIAALISGLISRLRLTNSEIAEKLVE